MVTKFRPPKECPVYHPTEEEFTDPMKYIAKIEPEAREYGICRIVPPPSFKPPFAADFDAFKFAPRIQLLHTLDGIARLRFSFNQSLRKFWQIFTPDYDWVIPEINGKIVDYFELHKAVESQGGYDAVCSKARWVEVARKCDVISASAIQSAATTTATQIQQPNGTTGGKKRGSGAQHTDEKATLDQWARYLKGEYDATVRPFFLLMRHADPECLYIFGHRGSSGGHSGSNKRPLSSYNSSNNTNNKRPTPPSRMQSRMQSRSRSSSNITASISSNTDEEPVVNIEINANCATAVETKAEDKSKDMIVTNDGATAENSNEAACHSSNISAGRSNKRSNSDSRFAVQQQPPPPPHGPGSARMLTRSNSTATTTGKSGRSPDEDDDLPVAGRLKRNRRTLSAVAQSTSYAEPTICAVCFSMKDEDSEELRQCDKCELFFHENCLGVGSEDYPKNCAWYCLNCLRDKLAELENHDAVGTDIRNYGFEITKREYSLSEFNHIADTFKAKYFGTQTPNEISQPRVEQEFWKLMQWQNPCEMIYMCVLYGADLRREMGSSGFPIQEDVEKLTSPADRQYVQHPWNLNNLPLQPGSVLKHIPGNISGMKVPWKYAGACFSAFCWHNEDHWTYSINYNHLGEPKTWYGVPGHAAEKFEEAFRKICPELLRANSDLLHQITTHLNPNLLQRHGVPVYRTDQRAGNFIITFPRAYHAGFNHGFNFAEAVNFCLASWIEWGRRAVDNYSRYKRLNVFAHDEMIVHCALNNPAAMSLGIKKAVYNDLCLMMRRVEQVEASSVGTLIPYRERVFFEHVPDEERQCDECCTTCFLVGIVCGCMQQSLANAPLVPGQMTLSARNNLSGGMRSALPTQNGASTAAVAEQMAGKTVAGRQQTGAPPGQPAPAGGGMMRNRMMSSQSMRHNHHHSSTQNSSDADLSACSTTTNAVAAVSGEPRFACPQHVCTKCTHDQMIYKYRCSFDELKHMALRVRALIVLEEAEFANSEHDDYIFGRKKVTPVVEGEEAATESVLPKTELKKEDAEPKREECDEKKVAMDSTISMKTDERKILIAKEEKIEPISDEIAVAKKRVYQFPQHAAIKKPLLPAINLPTLTPTSSVAHELSSLSVGGIVSRPPQQLLKHHQHDYYALSPPPSLASPDFALINGTNGCALPIYDAEGIGPMQMTRKEPIMLLQRAATTAAMPSGSIGSVSGRSNLVDRSI